MDIDRFWDLIQQARVKAGPAADQAVRDFDEPDDDSERDYWDFDELDLAIELEGGSSDPESVGAEADSTDDLEDGDDLDDDDDEISDPIAGALLELLVELPVEEIASFEHIFCELRAQADRDDLANAAVLIEHGFLGDDSFEDFRAGLVVLGRQAFENALHNPDSLAASPLVREIAAANDPRWLGREDLLYVAGLAYADVTGEEEITFVDFLEDRYPEIPEPADAGVDEDWAVTDEEQTRRRLPDLSALFYERSMRNRARAMEKLGLKG